MPLPKKIKDLVKNKRLYLKESQQEFGRRFGVSHAAISDLERGITTSIEEKMLIFVLEPNCLHLKRATFFKCLDCGYETRDIGKYVKDINE